MIIEILYEYKTALFMNAPTYKYFQKNQGEYLEKK